MRDNPDKIGMVGKYVRCSATLLQCPSYISLTRRSSSETREVRTVNKGVEKMYYYLIRRSSSDTRDVPNKDVEKMQDIDEKRRKCKIYLNLIMTARLARRLAGFAAEKWTFA